MLDALYEDTKKKVLAFCKFNDPDSLVTISMDGWQAPTGKHIRNYMWVMNEATFFFTATNAGTVRPTGMNINQETIKVIEDTGPNVAAITNGNAEAETTSWDTIRDEFPAVLCTGCTTHARALLFNDVCDHPWAIKLIEKSTKLAKFFQHHAFTNTEIRRRAKEAHDQEYAVIIHGATRFAGIYYTVKRLLFLKNIMREIEVSDGFEERNYKDADDIIAVLNDASYWKEAGK